MTKRTIHRFQNIVVATFLCLVGLFLPTTPLHAASTSGITLTPPFQEVLILPNQANVSGSFAVANNNTESATFNLSAIDMGALDDTGGVVFSGLSADYQQKYGLAQWLKLETDLVTIAPKSTKTIGFSIQSDNTFGPGGHYGAIIIKSSNGVGGSNNRVDLTPQAASLLFVRKVGGETYNLKFEKPPTKTLLWKLPNQVTVRLRNDGNVHVVPRGIVVLKDPLGHEVAKGIINSESSLILPERVRNYSVTLQQQNRLQLPGNYTIDVSYRYDGNDKFSTASYGLRFVNLPVILLGLIIAGLLVTILVIIVKKAKKWYHTRKNRPKAGDPKPASRHTFTSLRHIDSRIRSIKSKKK